MMLEKIYMTEKEAAIRYGYSVHWFRRTRWEGNGPPFLKMNNSQTGRIFYPIEQTDL